jgi:putative transposase
MIKLDKQKHSVSSLNYHLIFVVKYRREVLDDTIFARCLEILTYIGKTHNVVIKEANHDLDHIHLLINTIPSTNLVKFINATKAATSRLLKKEFPSIKEKLWKEKFWSGSYCLISVGGAPLETIKRYIQSQGGAREDL